MVDRPTEILLLEDEEAHAEAIRRAFQRRGDAFRLTMVDKSLVKQWPAWSRFTPDLVIADLVLPDGNGLDVLNAEKEKYAFPLVLMTSRGNEQVAVDAMKAGALDYVVKSPQSICRDAPYLQTGHFASGIILQGARRPNRGLWNKPRN